MKINLRFLSSVGCRLCLCLLFGAGTLSGAWAQVAKDTTSLYCDEDCCFTDPTPAGVMLSHVHPAKGWMLSYRYMYMYMSGNRSGSTSVGDNEIFQSYLMSPKNMAMHMHMLMAMYGLTDRLTFMAMFNYNIYSMQMAMLPGTEMVHSGHVMSSSSASMDMSSSGLGDTKLYALYNIVNRNGHKWMLSGGVSLPSGSIEVKGDANSMYPNERMPYTMQMGTGSVEVLPGFTYFRYTHSFSWSVQATAAIRANYNSLGYKLGNEVGLNAWVSYSWWHWLSTSLRLEASAQGKIDGRDKNLYTADEPAANPANYGGQRAHLFAGLNFYTGRLKNSRLAIEGGLPVYQQVNGVQMSTQAMLYASWQLAF